LFATLRLLRRLGSLRFLGGAGEVKFQEAGEDPVVAQVGGPAVGGGDREIQLLVRVVKPRRALDLEIRERTLLELGREIGVASPKSRIAVGADADLGVHRGGGQVWRPGPVTALGNSRVRVPIRFCGLSQRSRRSLVTHSVPTSATFRAGN